MKRHDLLFAAILVPLDYLVVLGAGWAAYALRFGQFTDFLPVVSDIPQETYIQALLVLGWLWVICLALSGVYAVRRQSLSVELGRISIGASFAVLVLIVTIFFRREYIASRFIVLAGWILSIVMLWIVHAIIRLIQRQLRRHGIGVARTVVFGDDDTTKVFVGAAHEQRAIGMTVVKVFPNITIDTLNEFEELVRTRQIDAALIGDPSISKADAVQVFERCTDADVSFSYAADLVETELGRVRMHDVAGIPVIEVQRTPLDGWGRITKRALDLIVGTLAFIIFLIPGLIVALAIKLDSAGPVFIRLDRVGQGQRKFRLWKFRSMVRDAHAMKAQLMSQNERGDGPLFKLQNDPRITRVGRFIRKTSLDELPQLFNVFAGTMSLVGPRPHEPEEVARYDRHHKKVLTIKPGMTGMAQVSGRSNLGFEDEVRLDTYYMEHWSLGLDMQILVRTPLAVLNTKTAA